jgi:hypothetical protein
LLKKPFNFQCQALSSNRKLCYCFITLSKP